MIRGRQSGLVLVWFLLSLLGSAGADNDRVLTPKQYIPNLAWAQTVLVEAQVRTQGGAADAAPVLAVLTRRLEEVGYTAVTDSAAPHDVTLRVVCEETLPSDGAPPMGRTVRPMGSPPHAPGQPCLVSYLYEEKPMEWQRVDRIIFTEGVQAAKAVAASTPRPGAMDWFLRFLEQFDFPLLLSAEWGQVERFRRLLEDPGTGRLRKVKIISLLGEIRADAAFQCLVEALHDEDLVDRAARALGNFGGKARAPLMDLLRTSPRSDVQAAAAYGLGLVGATTGDAGATPLLVEVLSRPGVARTVQIEIVWALGKAPHFSSHPALEALEHQAWRIRSDDPHLQELRKALQWTLRQVRQGGHTDAY